IEIETPSQYGFTEGASVACSGVCLTVTNHGDDWFAADVSAETLGCTTVGQWVAGTSVNIERPLKVGDELGGHMVLGHVDGVGAISARATDGESIRFTVEAPVEIMRFIAEKGSVALDGISLTVNQADAVRFGVNIIPQTQRATTLGNAEIGDQVNLEIDPLARYAAKAASSDLE
ncbi:MAG: riboflavin synthase, partial [Alphaproteobacteria bacterium]|nr:riboflavin synthase [Alphaproteobacteria bacterium]